MFDFLFSRNKKNLKTESQKQQENKFLHEAIDDKPLSKLEASINTPTTNTNQYQNFSNVSKIPTKTAPSGSNDWFDNDLRQKNPDLQTEITSHSKLNKLIYLAVGVLIMVLGVAGWVWSNDRGGIETDKIITRSLEPTEVVAGEELEVTVTVQNLNDKPLTNVELVTRFGEGGFSVERSKYNTTELGLVASGQTKEVQVPIVVVGKVGDSITLDYELRYSSPDSANEYVVSFDDTVTIDTSPISLSVSLPKELSVGETQNFNIEIGSNLALTYDQVTLEFDIPDTVAIIAQDEANKTDQANMFTLPAPKPNESKIFSGQLRADTAISGIAKINLNLVADNLILATDTQEVSIVLSPLVIREASKNGGLVAGVDRDIEFRVQNSTDSSITGSNLRFDFGNSDVVVRPKNGGRFDSATNTLVYDATTNSRLSSIRPGDSVDIEFGLTVNNPGSIEIQVTGTGLIAEQGVRRRDLANQSFNYQVEQQVGVMAYATYRRSNQNNTGPLPPQVGSQTTYTINLRTAINDQSLQPRSFTARIPRNVVLYNLPSDLEISGNQLYWDSPGKREELVFQARLTPEANQVGYAAVLLDDMVLEFTQRRETSSQDLGQITTVLDQDSGFSSSEAVVTAER